MGNCIICGTSTAGPICDVHQEDVVFKFEGDDASQLTPGRYYRGTVDGYAEFGVFIDIGPVTGLLHRSKLDRRLESLDWDVGDEVSVQVNNIRDNGDIDLKWSIRQDPSEFRGVLVDAPDGDYLADEYRESSSTNDEADAPSPSSETETVESEWEPKDTSGPTATRQPDDAQPTDDANSASQTTPEPTAAPSEPTEHHTDEDAITATDDQPTQPRERIPIESLQQHVGDVVRLEGEVVSVRQTSGPTVFELRDETGVVDCAAFVEAGVRAYPDIKPDDLVQLEGEVQLRRDELQVETSNLTAVEGDDHEAIATRLEEALTDRATPDEFEPLASDTAIEAIIDDIRDAAATIRRAVLESRPVVIRHDATTDGYVAGSAIERAVLPLIEEEHETADAVYHYFDRRPLEDGVYDMNDATKDATRMLGDRERYNEKLPLFVFTAAGSTAASQDGLDLLDIYDAPRVVIDGHPPDESISDEVHSLVTASDRTAATIASNVATAVNTNVRPDLLALPAISYWHDVPPAYDELVDAAEMDESTIDNLRRAIVLEAYYQSYEDKRELIIDLLFEGRTGLAEEISTQFQTKLDAELDTAMLNLDERNVDGTTISVLDTESYTHQYDFPPTRLLLDELARRLETDAILGIGTDELHIRTAADLDLDTLVAAIEADAPNAGITNPGARQPKLEFLAGERETVLETVIDVLADQLATASV